MSKIFKKRAAKRQKKKEPGFRWFRFTLGLSALLFAVSLLTPFPADLVRAIKGESFFDEIVSMPEDTPSPLPSDDNSSDNSEDNQNIIPLPDEGDVEPAPLPDEGDKEPPPIPAVPSTPAINPSTEEGDLSQLKPFRFPGIKSSYSLVFPPLPLIIPDGPSSDAVWDINEVARGFSYKSALNFKKGSLASKERENTRNYEISLTMDIVLPAPLSKPEEFKNTNPHLSSIFPHFDSLIKAGKVSGFYHLLMQNKQKELRNNLLRLNRILTRHNYYDCETILEITAPSTGRKVLWIQADMDVVSDGTDGDRLPTMPASIVRSTHYQPFTSYRWPKQTQNKNPLLAKWETNLRVEKAKKLRAEKAKSSTTQIQANIAYMQRAIEDMKNNSFLIAEYDPFIVVPLGIINNSQSPFAPSPGDYAVVIYGKKLYPAIVGDAGPRFKTGEASLRMAREINPKSSPYARPVSDLTVSYLIFPKSANPVKGPPDYAAWKTKCEELLKELGGISPAYSLHEWEDLLAPKKTAVPEEDKEPTETPTPTANTPSRRTATAPARR